MIFNNVTNKSISSQAAEEILAEAKETKIAADTQSNITDEHGLKLDEIEQRLNELEPNGVVCCFQCIHSLLV